MQAAQEAGLVTLTEPDTYNLLLGEFTKADCRRLFPKNGSKAYQAKFNAVLNALDIVSSPAWTMGEEAKLAYVQECIDQLPLVSDTQLKGLRIDASLVDPVTQETKWIDFSATQTTAASYIAAEMKNVGQKVTSTNLSSLFDLPDYAKAAPSPSLLKKEAEKTHKYSRLIIVAKRQTTEKKRSKTPLFAPFIVSSFGDLAPQAVEVQEWLVAAYARNCERLGPRSDGYSTAELVRSFRQRFKLNVQLAVAAGTGQMLIAAGQPHGNEAL